MDASGGVLVPDAAAMRGLGRRLAGILHAGDLVLLAGSLGAGKTTFTQGLGAGLDVRGPVTSPTFVIARVHPPLGGGPALVHVDAYRLGSFAEVDDLDLDASLEESVTVVEWGEGRAEGLAASRLEVVITPAPVPDTVPSGAEPPEGGPLPVDPGTAEPRVVRVVGVGPRWAGPAARQLGRVLAEDDDRRGRG